MAKSSAIVKISREAKRIQRLHPSMKWMACIKKASQNYRSGKIGALPAKLTTSLRPGKKMGKRRKAQSAKRRRIGAKENFAVVKKNGLSIGAVSAGTLKSELKKRLTQVIDKAVVRKYHATGKRVKRKIQDLITDKKAELRRLQ